MHNFYHRHTKFSIDAKTTGSTLLFTTKSNERFYPTSITMEVTAASVIVGVCTLSIGTNSATYNNILAATALTGMTAANKVVSMNLTSLVIDSIAASTGVYVNITVGATATTKTIKITIHGYYE